MTGTTGRHIMECEINAASMTIKTALKVAHDRKALMILTEALLGRKSISK